MGIQRTAQLSLRFGTVFISQTKVVEAYCPKNKNILEKTENNALLLRQYLALKSIQMILWYVGSHVCSSFMNSCKASR